MTGLYLSVAALLMIIGIIGCLVPIVPGPIVAFCGLLCMIPALHSPSLITLEYQIIRRRRMKTILALVCVFGICCSSVGAENKITYRDAQGRNMGSSSTDRSGKTIYRDAMGRKQGSSSTDRNGKTTYRDAQGRIQGTSTTDRYGKTTYRDAQGRIQGTMK